MCGLMASSRAQPKHDENKSESQKRRGGGERSPGGIGQRRWLNLYFLFCFR